MNNRKGFTLIEIIVVLVIIAILAVVALPNYMANIQQGAAKAAQNNLISIYGAERNFYLNNSYYCSTSTQNTTCANNLTNLNANLLLTIADNYFTYACTDPLSASDGNKGTSFSCTATSISAAAFTLTVTNNPIVLIGGVGTVNPSCTYVANPSYCPDVSS